MAPQLKSKNAETKSVAAALQQWLADRPANTRGSYVRYARHWSEFLGVSLDATRSAAKWGKANYEKAHAYVALSMRAPAQSGRSLAISKTVSLASVRHKAVVLKSCYDELISQGLLEINPFIRIVRDLKKYRGGERRPNQDMPLEAVRKLTQWTPLGFEDLRDLAVLNLLFGAALRRGEVGTLRCGDFLTTNKGTSYLRLIKTKSQTIQKVALPEWCAKIVGDYLAQRRREGARDGDPLIVRYVGRKPQLGVCGSWVYDLFKKYCRLFGLGDSYSPHCARVTAITQALNQQFSHREVQELSRHSSVQMVERYDRKRVEIDESCATKLRYED
jgi:integrase